MQRLAGRRILVVEDEFFIADDLSKELVNAGAEVIGPASSEADALRLLEDAKPDAAVLDINLDGGISFAVADVLADRNVPFIFATGYDPAIIPARHAGRRCWQKPFEIEEIVAALLQ